MMKIFLISLLIRPKIILNFSQKRVEKQKKRKYNSMEEYTHTRTHTRTASKGQQKKHHIKREGAAYQASSKPVNQKYQSCPPSRHGSSFLFFPLLLQSPSSAVQTRAQARPLGPKRHYFGLHTRGSQLALPPCCHARPPGQVVTFGWSSQLFSYKEQRKQRAMRGGQWIMSALACEQKQNQIYTED